MKNIRGQPIIAVALLCAVVFAGCRSIGPGTIPRDRFSYSSALADSWKNQMLLNIVKTRYLDLPIFLDIGQIVSGYSLETSASVGLGVPEKDTMGGNTSTFGGSTRFTDRPTITYNPLTGDKFLEGYLAPIDPAKILFLLQAGYSADFILSLGLDALGGLRNQPVSLGARHQADPDFFRALALLREIQDAAALGVRVDRSAKGPPATVLYFRNSQVAPEVLEKIARVHDLLGLAPDQAEFRVVSSPVRGGPGELTIATRSLSQMLSSLAMGVEVPPAHLARKLTPPVSAALPDQPLLLQVHGGSSRPDDAFVSVPYEGQWFWIASEDWPSKRTFSSILFLFTLANPGTAQNLPTLTISTQ